MTKEELIELKNKIPTMTKEELIEYEDYLIKVSKGEIDESLTGYPSIDKPWLKYFIKEELYKEREKRTVYQEVYDNNKEYLKDLSLEFFGTKIKYDQLFKNIDKTAKALEEYGVKKGDIVTICCAGIPETVYTFYALSKIGAVANLMSPYFDEKDMSKRINDCESKLLIVMDKFFPIIEKSINQSSIREKILLPTMNSSKLKFITKTVKPSSKNEYMWNTFIKDGNHRSLSDPVRYEKGMPLALVYSSGTTGASKAILLSNDSFQNSIQAYPASGVDISRGQKFYQIIPPWYSTGLSTSIHLPLSYGVSVFMDPRFERDVFVKNIIKHKPNYAVAATSMYEGFLDEKLVGNSDLHFFNYPFEGGEPLKESQAKKIEAVFKKHGSDSKLRTAYGECECGAAITTEVQGIDHPYGSVGIPLPGITIGIFDEEKKELKYGERGEILADTPCGMTEYYKNPSATEEFFYIDEFGTKWSCTGDIGYIDKNGNLYIEGRKNDFTIVEGHKVYNFDVENIISEMPEIKMCDVIENNNKLAVHMILEDSIKSEMESNLDKALDLIEKIQIEVYEKSNDQYMVPELFKIRTEFPYAKSGKRNVDLMKSETEGFLELSRESIKSHKKVLTKDK